MLRRSVLALEFRNRGPSLEDILVRRNGSLSLLMVRKSLNPQALEFPSF